MEKDAEDTKAVTRHGALNEKHENQARWMLAVTGNMRRNDVTATFNNMRR